MTDSSGQDKRPTGATKERAESLSSRIKDGVGRHLTTVSQVGNQQIQSLRTKISSALNRSDSQINQVEDSGNKFASHSEETGRLPAQTYRPDDVQEATVASNHLTGFYNVAPSRINPTAPFQDTFRVHFNDHDEQCTINIVTQARQADKQTVSGRPNQPSIDPVSTSHNFSSLNTLAATTYEPPAQPSGVAGIKQIISQPDLLISDRGSAKEPKNTPTNRTDNVSKRHSFSIARTFSPESDSAEVLNISADNPRQKAAALLVSPCLETRESILKKSLHQSDVNFWPDQSSSSDDTLHLAVPLFTKDVHMAYKGFVQSESQEVPRPPPESVFPKRTIIVNRFESGSPYLDIPSYRPAVTVKKATKNTHRTLNALGAALDDSHSPQGAFHVSVSSMVPPDVHIPPNKLYPYVSTSTVHPFSMPVPPPSLSVPPLPVPQPLYYWTQHAPLPSAPYVEPMNAHRTTYSRHEEVITAGTNYRRFPAFGFRKKMESVMSFLFGSNRAGHRDEACCGYPSYTERRAGHRDEACCGHPSYTERQSSLNNMFNIGRDSSFSTHSKGYDRGPDDLLLQLACCCCWPIGLAAKLLICMFPNEVGRGSCLGMISRQVSIYILLMGTALYIFIMVIFISMLLALSKDSHH